MQPAAAAAAVARKRVKRAMGLLREAAAGLAAELEDLDVAGEVTVDADGDVDQVAQLVRLARQRAGRPIVVAVVTAPAPHHSPREGQRRQA